MQEERLIELLVELHKGLPRLGPGNTQSTLKALGMCDLPDAPEVLDVGCGSGAQTLVLTSATNGNITATDLFPTFLEQLNSRAHKQGFGDRLRTLEADMNALPFDQDQFDLIWSEGAVYIMGFDNGLTKWQRFAKPGGYIVVTEISWFTDNPPKELTDFWSENYPGMRSISENLDAAQGLGLKLIGNFHLPLEAWTEDYYGPLKMSIPAFREKHADDEDAQAVADMTEYEIQLMDKYHQHYGYEFYIFQTQA